MKPRRPLASPVSLAALVLGAACLTGLLALAIDGRGMFSAVPLPRAVPTAPIAAVAPPRDPVSAPPAAPPPAEAALLDPLPGAAPLALSPPFEVPDGLTIKTETQIVRLAGLEAPWTEAVCFDPDGKLWACGLQARAALYNLIRREDLVCLQVAPAKAVPPRVTCKAGTGDLALALVAKGFARPVGPQGSAMQRAADAAKAGGLGLWNGGWRIRS